MSPQLSDALALLKGEGLPPEEAPASSCGSCKACGMAATLERK